MPNKSFNEFSWESNLQAQDVEPLQKNREADSNFTGNKICNECLILMYAPIAFDVWAFDAHEKYLIDSEKFHCHNF